jgi:DNA-binding Xre family transcriptional regulator
MTFCNLLILLGLLFVTAMLFCVAAADVMLEKLKAARVRPVDLAKALGVDRSAASLMLAGKRGIPTWHLDAIAALLGIGVADLFSRGPNDAAAAASAGVLEEARELLRLIQPFTSAILPVADRLARNVARATAEPQARTTERRSPDRVRGTRKVG